MFDPECIEGRTVALVGRAASLLEHGDGARIDAADLVIRVNWLWPWAADPRRVGYRTDCIIRASTFPQLEDAAREGGIACWPKEWKIGVEQAQRVGLDASAVNPRTGIQAIEMVLRRSPRLLYVTGYDLYESGAATESAKKNPAARAKRRKRVEAGKKIRKHCYEADEIILRDILTRHHDCVEIDGVLRRRLDALEIERREEI